MRNELSIIHAPFSLRNVAMGTSTAWARVSGFASAYAPLLVSVFPVFAILSMKKRKVKPWSQDWFIAAGAYPSFCSMKRQEVFLLPLEGMLVHPKSLPHNLLGLPNNSPVPIYTLGWREAL